MKFTWNEKVQKYVIAGAAAVVVFAAGIGGGMLISANGSKSSKGEFSAAREEDRSMKMENESFSQKEEMPSEFEGGRGKGKSGLSSILSVYDSLSDANKKTVQSILNMTDAEIQAADTDTIQEVLENLTDDQKSQLKALAEDLMESGEVSMPSGKNKGMGEGENGMNSGSDSSFGNKPSQSQTDTDSSATQSEKGSSSSKDSSSSDFKINA